MKSRDKISVIRHLRHDERHLVGAGIGTLAIGLHYGALEVRINYNFSSAGFDGSLDSFQGISGGTDVALMVVPEPGAISMLAASLGLGVGLGRFRRRSARKGA